MRRSHRIRLVLMACVLIVFAAAFIAAECLPPTSTVGQCVNVGEREFCQGGSGDGGGGGGPTATPVLTTIYKSGTQEFHFNDDGAYGGSITVTGHTITQTVSGDVKQVFDINAGKTKGVEVCPPTADQTDWNYFGQLYPQSPYTITGSGRYATGPFDCLLGHFIFGYTWYWWQNATNPTISPMEIVPDANGFVNYHQIQ